MIACKINENIPMNIANKEKPIHRHQHARRSFRNSRIKTITCKNNNDIIPIIKCYINKLKRKQMNRV